MQSSVVMKEACIVSAVGSLCNVKTEAVTMIRTIVYNGHFTYHVEKGFAGEQEKISVYKLNTIVEVKMREMVALSMAVVMLLERM